MTQPARFATVAFPAALVIGALALAAPRLAHAHEPPSATDPRWLAWIGCWAPSGASEDAAPTVSGVHRVCIAPVDSSEGVELVSVGVSGEILTRTRLEASPSRRAVDREGCTGWETAQWSADAERLYLHSELTCAGSIARRSSGIIAVVSPSDWVDIQIVSVGDQRSTHVLRYRSAADTSALGRGIAARVRDRELARQASRLAAASSPTIDDVIEASRAVDASVVEAWLVHRMPRFTVDKSILRRLGDAQVPASVVDLVIALDSPERYGHKLRTRGYTFIRIDPPRQTTIAVATPRTDVQTSAAQIGGGWVEGREFYGHNHRHYRGCGHFDLVYISGIPIAPYAFYPYWLRDRYGYFGSSFNGYYGSYYNGYYGGYGGYGYYPYDIPDPYQPAKPATTRGVARAIDLPDRRPTQPAPQPNPDPGPQPAGGRVVKGGGYTRPAEPGASRASAGTSAPAPQRTPAKAGGSSTKSQEPRGAGTPPVPPTDSRTAKRRPPAAD